MGIKKIAIASFTTIVVLLFQQSWLAWGQVKGGYWYYDSGVDASSIDSSLYTHLYCAFAALDANTFQATLPSNVFSTFTQTVKRRNPNVNTFLSVGGGFGGNLSLHFSAMASQSSTRKAFIDSTIQLARSNGFGGVDLDWEYPSSDADRNNLALLLQEWQAANQEDSRNTGRAPLLLTAAVAGSNQISSLQYYPIAAINDYTDWLNLMVYDLFIPEQYRSSTQPPAPLYNPGGVFSADEGVSSWIGLGIAANRLTFGLPFYGYAWNLVNPNNNGLFAPAAGPAQSSTGSMTYRQIRDFINNQRPQQVYHSAYVTNYCYSGNTWIGYDDTQSVSAKIIYAKGRGMVGYFSWQVSGDDTSSTLARTAYNTWDSSLRGEQQGSAQRLTEAK
ncbi:hypothetical protein HN51_002310 [Arachis hypogaea]|uniref:GH18 domain-containing protein n=2 Tax=Arachis TaxID=3817 RepID=A0A445EMV1_ARAHY|nr:class V chitinase isoform X1 [Arachis duranensis]XP_025607594.1 class V chitinase isoform X1 [Arachis hypogaea]QHO50506.1 Chitinase-3-like protein [Arachis hypogaea]RYR76795.1 hypothetical protein Ahy_A01g001338 [Arachis hypogaea]